VSEPQPHGYSSEWVPRTCIQLPARRNTVACMAMKTRFVFRYLRITSLNSARRFVRILLEIGAAEEMVKFASNARQAWATASIYKKQGS